MVRCHKAIAVYFLSSAALVTGSPVAYVSQRKRLFSPSAWRYNVIQQPPPPPPMRTTPYSVRSNSSDDWRYPPSNPNGSNGSQPTSYSNDSSPYLLRGSRSAPRMGSGTGRQGSVEIPMASYPPNMMPQMTQYNRTNVTQTQMPVPELPRTVVQRQEPFNSSDDASRSDRPLFQDRMIGQPSQPMLEMQSNIPYDATAVHFAETGGPHYGEAPRRQPRRYNTKKRVKLFGGNLVLDCPVPSKYLAMVPRRQEKEFTHMRYTAATCDPSEFVQQGFTLRQALMSRRTELFIVVTMYNEDEILFTRTMHGIMKNIAGLCTHHRSRTWGENAWQKVVVCIVSDGRSKIHPRTLNVLAAMGVYQEGIAKNVFDGKPVTAHIYEYTTQVSVGSDMKFRGANEDIVPVQILFCLKEKNAKKINSHRWFFQAFGPIIDPNICVLLDVGTRPGNTAIYNLWKVFDLNSNVAGACGEIRAMLGTGGVNLLNPLVGAQHFEYKMSNILDKPLESVFGYISVLPGAFSAYRYISLQNDVNGNGPLQKYYLGETQHGAGAGIFTANMYLAEDRILCFELVAKKDAAWILRYVSSAFGETDVPDQVPEFISQRRRWLNGSFFAGVYALVHCANIFHSDHGATRKMLLMIENLYMSISLLFSWFAIGNFYLTFFILTQSLSEMQQPPFDPSVANILHTVLQYVYIVLLILQLVMAMGNRPQGSKWAYTGSMIFFALLMGYMLFAAAWLAYVGISDAIQQSNGQGVSHAWSLFTTSSFRDILISVASTYIMYFVASVLFLDPWHMFTSFVPYLFMMPSYTNVLNIYAFCNTHDVSWGTKGDTSVALDLGVVASQKDASGNHTAEVNLPSDERDLNAAYEDALHELSKKNVVKIKQQVDAKTKQDDYYKAFRTRLVIFWILSNIILVAVITNRDLAGSLGSVSQRGNGYLTFILWSVAGLSAFRFLGAVTYLMLRMFTG